MLKLSDIYRPGDRIAYHPDKWGTVITYEEWGKEHNDTSERGPNAVYARFDENPIRAGWIMSGNIIHHLPASKCFCANCGSLEPTTEADYLCRECRD